MLELLKEIVYEVTGKTELSLDTDFVQDLELNSFDIMSIIGKFEERLDITIPTRDVWNLHQVHDVLEYLRKKGICLPSSL